MLKNSSLKSETQILSNIVMVLTFFIALLGFMYFGSKHFLSFYFILQMPIEASIDKTIVGCCDCCEEPGIWSIKLSLEKTAYVSGEPLVYSIEIRNTSNKSIDSVVLILQQVNVSGFL